MPAQELSLGITLAVLGAGLLHAGWNALLKAAPGGEPMLDTASVVAVGAAAGSGSVEIRRDVVDDPLRVLRDAGARVPHG